MIINIISMWLQFNDEIVFLYYKKLKRGSGTGGGTASYGWNGAGLLNSDTSRGITRTTYNHLSLPTSVTFSDKSHIDYTYNAAGEVQTVTTYAMVAGAKRPIKVGQRSYCGDFVEKCAGVLRLCNLWWLGDWWIFCNFAVYEWN